MMWLFFYIKIDIILNILCLKTFRTVISLVEFLNVFTAVVYVHINIYL